MKKLQNLLLCGLGGVVAVWLTLRFFLPIGLPFLLGLGLSQLALLPTRRLRKRVPFLPFLSVTLVAAALSALAWLIGHGLLSGAEVLGARLPALFSSLAGPLSALQTSLSRLAARLPDGLSTTALAWLDRFFAGSSVLADRILEAVLSLAGRLLAAIPDLFLFTLTLLLSAYLFTSERDRLRGFLARHIPPTWRARSMHVGKKLLGALWAYLKTQCKLSGVIFCLSLVGLALLGVRRALLLSAVVALVDALPVFGAGTVLLPWSAVAFLRGGTFLGVGLVCLYAVCSVTRTVLEPRFLGRQIGLDPLLTLFSLYAGYRLFGFLGMLLLPIAAISVKQLCEIMESA